MSYIEMYASSTFTSSLTANAVKSNMKPSSGISFIDKISFKLLFFLLFVYQLLFIFQGVNVADEGFHATFYELIFKDPESVQYNFMFC